MIVKLVFSALAAASLSADTINIFQDPADPNAGSFGIAQFDPSLGTLESVGFHAFVDSSIVWSFFNPTGSTLFFSGFLGPAYAFLGPGPGYFPLVSGQDLALFSGAADPGGTGTSTRFFQNSFNKTTTDNLDRFTGSDTWDLGMSQSLNFCCGQSVGAGLVGQPILNDIRRLSLDVEYTYTPVPEPSLIGLMAIGIAGMGVIRFRLNRGKP